MAGLTAIQLLRSQKATLIEILSGDADFVLQHADSRNLLSRPGYEKVKACRIPNEKVTELLDHVIHRGHDAAQGLLELLNEKDLQDTFPRLDFIKHLQVNILSSGRLVTIFSNAIIKYCLIFSITHYLWIFSLFTRDKSKKGKREEQRKKEKTSS